VTVRRGRREDARRLAEIHVETWRATYPGVMPQELLDNLSVEGREAQWLEWLPNPDYDTFVVESEGEVVGFVSVGPCRDTDGIGELFAIYVVPSAHGTGAGPALMDAALEALGERWDAAMLWVATQNPRARRFYERHGWVAAGERVDTSFPGAAVPETRYEVSGLSRR
jgi:ribosomal protein S18 acetylase RimI-like enzyme